MYRLYTSISKAILRRFPKSHIISHFDSPIDPPFFSTAISIRWSPPSVVVLESSRFGTDNNSLFLAIYPVIFSDEMGVRSVVHSFSNNGSEFTSDEAPAFYLAKSAEKDLYRVTYIDPALDPQEYYESENQFINRIIARLSVPDTGRPY